MKIVVVDHVHLDPKHVERLRSLGDLQIFKELSQTKEELKSRIRDADIVIVGWSRLTREVINSAWKLKMISIWASSCHYVDLDAAKERGIVVTHVPGYSTEAVAEHTFALLLAAVRKLSLADWHVKNGEFDWSLFTGTELKGKTLGIIGTGAIGFRVAEIARAFEMRILGYTKHPNPSKTKILPLKYVDLQTLLRESDVITLHVAMTPETSKLIGKKEILNMKDGVVIINTSQGNVMDEKALIEALISRKVSCAGLDVMEKEPPHSSNPLFRLDNVVLSPHIGFNTQEASVRCTDLCVENLVKFLEGTRQNVCM